MALSTIYIYLISAKCPCQVDKIASLQKTRNNEQRTIKTRKIDPSTLIVRYSLFVNFMDLISSLNEKQQEAVRTIEGPLLILAGPGSGKTKTLTHRIAYLISRGIKPYNILALTFTNKAASVMKERVHALLSAQGDTITAPGTMPLMGTFHAVCARMLREHAPLLGYTSRFIIYDAADQLSLMKKVMKNLDMDTKQTPPQKILHTISRAKDDMLTPNLFEEQTDTYGAHGVSKAYHAYQDTLVQNNAFDFDDLIMQIVLLLQHDAGVLKKYQNRFRYILVDEYQDTNTAQYTLVHMLAKESKNICVVGDDAQAIYSWRNANFQNILDFERDWPEAKVIKLEQNYRSTKNIVAAASELVAHNQLGYPKNLWTKNPEGELIAIRELSNEYEEGEFILGEIEHQVAQKKYRLSDFVVLYRTNAQSRALEEVFIRGSMPYKIVGGTKFYQRQEVKDAIAWLRLLVNPHDTPSLDRLERLKVSVIAAKLPQKPRTKKVAIQLLLKDFQEKAKNEMVLGKLLKYIFRKSNYEKLLRDGTEKGEERWQNAQELLSVSEEYAHLPLEEALEKFLEDVALAQEADNVEYQSNLIHLMTLHMAKGLEFPVVFIAGCEEGILPHASSMLTRADLEEERRLCYVGLTRAKEKAYMLFTRRRMIAGSVQSNPPSSFIHEIPEKYLDIQQLGREEENDDVIEWN